MSYIKPLNASLGPKQTKCVITDENVHVEPDNYISNLTTTSTPDVPSGNQFCVRTKTSLTWAKGGGCKVHVTCTVEWSKVNRFLKGEDYRIWQVLTTAISDHALVRPQQVSSKSPLSMGRNNTIKTYKPRSGPTSSRIRTSSSSPVGPPGTRRKPLKPPGMRSHRLRT